jgi:hypothetical protein
MKRAAFGVAAKSVLLLLPCAVLCLLSSCGPNALARDATLKAHFFKHRAEFEELIRYYRAHKLEGAAIPMYEDENKVSPEERKVILAMLHKLDLRWIYAEADFVRMGFQHLPTWTKGYEFKRSTPQRIDQSLDPPLPNYEPGSSHYTPLGDGWYLYLSFH